MNSRGERKIGIGGRKKLAIRRRRNVDRRRGRNVDTEGPTEILKKQR